MLYFESKSYIGDNSPIGSLTPQPDQYDNNQPAFTRTKKKKRDMEDRYKEISIFQYLNINS